MAGLLGRCHEDVPNSKKQVRTDDMIDSEEDQSPKTSSSASKKPKLEIPFDDATSSCAAEGSFSSHSSQQSIKDISSTEPSTSEGKLLLNTFACKKRLFISTF